MSYEKARAILILFYGIDEPTEEQIAKFIFDRLYKKI